MIQDLNGGELDLGNLTEGTFTTLLSLPPDPDGTAGVYDVKAPAFNTFLYYAPIQKHAINPKVDVWPDGYNQLHGQPYASLTELKRGGMAMVFELSAGGYGVLMPVPGVDTIAWLSATQGQLKLHVSHYGNAPYSGRAPLAAWVTDGNVYRAVTRAVEAVLAAPGSGAETKLRTQKSYPEVFTGLGWCTWEEYKLDIDEGILLRDIAALSKSKVPIQWMLIDDGHLHHRMEGKKAMDAGGGEVLEGGTSRRLLTHEPDPAKFPRGWGPVVEAFRKSPMKHLGIWLNFNGYWGGLSPDFRPVPTVAAKGGGHQPGPDPKAAIDFWEDAISRRKAAGFDFLKVDNQGYHLDLVRGHVPRAVALSRGMSRGLEDGSARHMKGLINCMAHGAVPIWNTRQGSVSRCSEDYKAHDPVRARLHLHNSYQNMLFLGQTVWGDHDMFHSTDSVEADVMARSKALSGGPVYISDLPDQMVVGRILPLVDDRGKVLRPLAPATALPESLFIDPYLDGKPYRVIAPCDGGAASLCVYNLTNPEQPVTGFVSSKDYPWASALMQGEGRPWDMPMEGVVGYDTVTGEARLLTETPWTFPIPKYGDRLFHLAPVRDGLAVIGMKEKHLAPAAAPVTRRGPGRCFLDAACAGTLLLWTTAVIESSRGVVVRTGDLTTVTLETPGALALSWR